MNDTLTAQPNEISACSRKEKVRTETTDVGRFTAGVFYGRGT